MFIFFYIQRGRTPLLSAIDRGLSDVAQLLINKGASIDVTDDVSQSNKPNSKSQISCVDCSCIIEGFVIVF